jgi:competence protein ComEC
MERIAAPVPVAAAAICATLLVQSLPALPGASLWSALGAFAALAAVAAARIQGGRPILAGGLALTAVAAAAAAFAGTTAADRMAQRLPPALEGRSLQLVGVVDELPTPIEHGTRFTLRVELCTVASPAGDVGHAEAIVPGADGSTGDGPTEGLTDPSPRVSPSDRLPEASEPGCGRLARASLSWRSGFRTPGRAPAPTIRPGERWALDVRLRQAHAAVNPGAFDRELRWLQEGIGAVGSVRSGRRLAERAGGPRVSLERLRLAIRDGVFDAAGPGRAREAGVLAALAIGDQAAIDPRLWTVFNQTGVGHLMSISGLHITMLAALGGAFAGRLWRSRMAVGRGSCVFVPVQRVRLTAAVAVGLAYALLAGWGIPAQRTVLMLCCAAVLLGTGRGASIAAAVAVAALVVVALDPWAPLAAGFWLSFGAVIAIVVAAAGSRFGDGRFMRAARAAVRTQWAATVALLPLGAWFFASFSVVGPVANALAIPLVSAVITPLALAGGALALVSPSAGAPLLVPAAWLVDGLLRLLDALASVPGASVAVPRPGAAVLAMTLAALALLLAPLGVPRRALAAIALLPIAALPLRRPAAGELWLTALDVGQGMAVVVQVADRVLVYDTGPRTSPVSDAGARVLVPWLRGEGVAKPDAVVVSHQDLDHAGGAASLLAAMPPDWFASSLPDGHPLHGAVTRSIRCRRGERWRWGEAEFEWLHPTDPPEPARGSPSNAASCVLRVRTAAGAALLAGDIGVAQERRLLELYGPDGLRADVLVVPHHGSASSSGEAFVAAVAPRWAVMQVGYRNAFRHPHPTVVERYRRLGAEVLRSDAHGAIAIRLAPDRDPEVVASRRMPARYWRIEVDDEAPAVTARSNRRPSATPRRAPARLRVSTGTPRARRSAPG